MTTDGGLPTGSESLTVWELVHEARFWHGEFGGCEPDEALALKYLQRAALSASPPEASEEPTWQKPEVAQPDKFRWDEDELRPVPPVEPEGGERTGIDPDSEDYEFGKGEEGDR